MRASAHPSAIPGAVLGLGIWLLTATAPGRAADAGGTVLPDAYYPKMLQYGIKGVQDSLKGSPKEELVGKARTTAIMIAAYAQQNLSGADGQQRATVRDAALKVAKAIDDKKYGEASKMAGDLATLPANPKAKTEKIKLIDDQVSFKSLMNQFNHPPEGGWGIHRQFYQFQLGMKGIPTTELKDALVFRAYQVAVTADLMSERVPKTKQKEWAGYTGELRKGAVDLADAVKAKDGKTGLDAIAKITNSCTSCHKVFGGGPK